MEKLSWNVLPKEAREFQRELAGKISLESAFKKLTDIRKVIGCDIGYSSDGALAYVSLVAMELPGLKLIQKKTILHKDTRRFPYIPGLLSFREGPALELALKIFGIDADVYLFDGQGIAHPRRLGIASHMGLVLNKPTVGCAKSLLYGRFEEPPPGLRGAYNFLKDPADDDIIGIVLRTRPYVKPVFVSPGHMTDFNIAGDLVMACTTKYRLPEPLRLAHNETMKKL